LITFRRDLALLSTQISAGVHVVATARAAQDDDAAMSRRCVTAAAGACDAWMVRLALAVCLLGIWSAAPTARGSRQARAPKVRP
jgi:hypothetical protein